jgi:hypothetical protein
VNCAHASRSRTSISWQLGFIVVCLLGNAKSNSHTERYLMRCSIISLRSSAHKTAFRPSGTKEAIHPAPVNSDRTHPSAEILWEGSSRSTVFQGCRLDRRSAVAVHTPCFRQKLKAGSPGLTMCRRCEHATRFANVS